MSVGRTPTPRVTGAERPYAVLHYAADCALLATWEQPQLAGFATPTPRTPVPPLRTPSATGTLPALTETPGASATITSTAPAETPGASATITSTAPSPTPSGTPTATTGGPSWSVYLPLAVNGEIPRPATFALELIPPAIRNSVPGQRCVFLVTLREDTPGGSDEAVALSAAAQGGVASVAPAAIRPGQVGEVTLVPAMASQQETLTLHVTGRRGREVTTATAELEVLEDMPGVDEERGASAAEVRDRFVPWLARHHPELGITADTAWQGTIVTPWILVVMHYLFFSPQWEMHVSWHVMIEPHDWARIDLRHRWDETKPSRAFEISSWGNQTEPIEIDPPEEIWR